ncbi:MAG: hypothetical protein JNG89_20060, partial [Planctomycetaceae bacterium]|nr:hypothetical protein [Planctomycetaceae bacterium]
MPSRRKSASPQSRPAAPTARDQVRLPALAMFVAAGFWTSALLVFLVFTVWQQTSGAAPDGGDGPISAQRQIVVQIL